MTGEDPAADTADQLSLFESNLRTPLNALVTSADLLVEDLRVLSPQQVRERMSALQCRALTLHMVAENLFCASAIGDGRLRLQPQKIALDEVISEVSAAVLPLLRLKRQRLTVGGQGCNARVVADPRRIGQVLMNLLWSASSRASEHSALEIAASATEVAVRVEISAGGPRIPDPSCRSLPLAPQANEFNGSLGVDVARSIVQAHGGTLTSTHGDAVRYWFELPLS